MANARRFREHALPDLDEILHTWEEKDDEAEGRVFLNQAAALLDRANALFVAFGGEAMYEALNKLPAEGAKAYLQEIEAAERFYADLIKRIEAAGLGVRRRVRADAEAAGPGVRKIVRANTALEHELVEAA